MASVKVIIDKLVAEDDTTASMRVIFPEYPEVREQNILVEMPIVVQNVKNIVQQLAIDMKAQNTKNAELQDKFGGKSYSFEVEVP